MPEGKKPAEAWEDPVVAEVRSVRSSLFAAAGNDVREYCRRARERQVLSGRPVVTRESGHRIVPPSRQAG